MCFGERVVDGKGATLQDRGALGGRDAAWEPLTLPVRPQF